MKSLAALSYAVLKSALPVEFVAMCSGLKKKFFEIKREETTCQFLYRCLDNKVVPKYLVGNLLKKKRKKSTFDSTYGVIIMEEINKRILLSSDLQKQYDDLCKSISPSLFSLSRTLISHFCKNDIFQLNTKHENQIKSLIFY